MGRFSYIPLDYDKLNKGSEREVLLKKDTNDLYILDDYKVPVAITPKLRSESSKLMDGISVLENDIDSLNVLYKGYIAKLIELGKTIDKLIYDSENTIYNRVLNLEMYKNNLKNYYNEVVSDFNNIKKELSNIMNLYKADIDAILKTVVNRYDVAKANYDKIIKLHDDYKTTLDGMQSTITYITNELKKKMLLLGNGSGSLTGSKVVASEKEITFIASFFWMSNNPETYRGKGGNPSWNDSPPDLMDYCAGASYEYMVKHNDFLLLPEGYTDKWCYDNFNKEGTQYGPATAWYWIEELQDKHEDGSTFTSLDSRSNRYGRKMAIEYTIKVQDTIRDNFTYQIV